MPARLTNTMKTGYALLLSSTLLVSCADTTDTPSQVADKYWKAIQQGDTETAKQFITTTSIDTFDDHVKAFINMPIDTISTQEMRSTVETIINPDAQDPANHITLQTTLVLEGDQWKIDLNNTQLPSARADKKDMEAMADKLSDSIYENIETIENMVDEGMDLLEDALHEGSEEMSKTMLEAMKEINKKMNESINNMKQRRLKKQGSAEDTEKSEDAEPASSGEGPI